ncbi:DUF1904 domain-containing protein [Clostridium sediminicola]|uniref:DUF1904 family protein n=1 Tax=Clostridium sediminicola TaxID=3114879 RepID=UPI0031F27AA8
MPQITFKGIKTDELCSISKELKDNLEKIIGCERKHIKFDIINSLDVDNGTVIESFPRAQMLWFPRDQKMQDTVAKEITEQLYNIGYKHIQVTFNVFKPENFYENAKHY